MNTLATMVSAGAMVGLWCLAAGCGHGVQQSPALSAPAPTAPAAEEKGFFTQAGETTWDVVSTPVRMVVPKKVEKKEPDHYEPSDAVIMTPGGDLVGGGGK